MKKQKGFTLIELVVVVVIIGILASIAIPSYREYVKRGNRHAAQAAMMDIAARQQQFFVANRMYATAADLSYVLPSEIFDKYDIDIDVEAGPPPGFTITFDPKGSQEGDGNLTLDSEGNKTGKW
jgi:type IV pilus assembly protein PilE